MAVTIRTLPLGFDNIDVVRDKRTIVVDGGEPGRLALFVRRLGEARIASAAACLIVATHGHWDPIGCLAETKPYTGAPLAMHAADRDSVEAPRPVMPPGVTPWGRFISALLTVTLMPRLKIPAATVDSVVADEGMSLEPYGVRGRILHTPGHTSVYTPGSVSVVLASGDAIVGDLATNRMPLRSSPGLPIFADDLSQARHGIERLLAVGARTIYPAHGKAFPAGVLKAAVAAM